jgi:hypothetical protein
VTVSHALLVSAGTLAGLLFFILGTATRSGRLLEPWLAWTVAFGGLVFGVGLAIGQTISLSLGGATILLCALIVLGRFRRWLWDLIADRRARREEDYDASGNPRPRNDKPKTVDKTDG